MYTVVAIVYGKKVTEYKDEHIMRKEALHRHPRGPSDPNRIFYFGLESDSVIDAKYGSSRARWINHACKPSHEAWEADDRVFIHALRDVEVGGKLFYDYGLVVKDYQTRVLKEQFVCRYGAKKCCGTMLAPSEKTKKK